MGLNEWVRAERIEEDRQRGGGATEIGTNWNFLVSNQFDVFKFSDHNNKEIKLTTQSRKYKYGDELQNLSYPKIKKSKLAVVLNWITSLYDSKSSAWFDKACFILIEISNINQEILKKKTSCKDHKQFLKSNQ